MSEKSASNKIKKDKRMILLVAGALIGVVLLLFGGLSDSTKKKSEDGEASLSIASLDADEYEKEVEKRIKELCSSVKGAGHVEVAVTLRGGYRAVYATDSQSSSGGYKSSTVLTGSGSSEGAVLICYENPEISGVGIVCSGGDDPSVRSDIVALIAAAFDIGTNKIYVAKG